MTKMIFLLFDTICTLLILSVLISISGCGPSLGRLKENQSATLRLNQVYSIHTPSLTGSINRKGPLFFTLLLPPTIKKEWERFQHTGQATSINEEVNSSWIQGNFSPDGLILNSKLPQKINLKPYLDLQGH